MKCACAVIVIAVSSTGCASATASLKTFTDPSISASAVKAVAVLPMRNARLQTDESREVNRSFTQALTAQNLSLRVIGPTEAVDSLNARELTDKYSDFLRNYATSGIPDARSLREIGTALGVDAIIQGEVFDVTERDGSYGGGKGETRVTVRYSMLACRTGAVLWEATSRGVRGTATTLEKAPPLYEAITLAMEKITSSLPQLRGSVP